MAKIPVKINLNWCKACGICISVCPKKAFAWSGEIGERGVRVPEVKRPGQCIYCMLCEMMCPDFAIAVVDRKKGKAPARSKPKPKTAPKKKPKPKKKAKRKR